MHSSAVQYGGPGCLRCRPQLPARCLFRRPPPRPTTSRRPVRVLASSNSSIAALMAPPNAAELTAVAPDLGDSAAAVTWLRRRLPFSQLPASAVSALANRMQAIDLAEGAELAEATGIVVVAAGSLLALPPAASGTSAAAATPPVGLGIAAGAATSPYLAAGAALGPGSVLNWQEVLLETRTRSRTQSLPESVTRGRRRRAPRLLATTPARLWLTTPAAVAAAAESSPAAFSAAAADALAAKLDSQQAALVVLLPYLVGSPRRGLLGSSKYAARLASAVAAAASDAERRPVLVFGEPGLEKGRVAALIHFTSPGSDSPLARVEASSLGGGAPLLFGPSPPSRDAGDAMTSSSRDDDEEPGRPWGGGLLAALEGGGLLINDAHRLPPESVPAIRSLLADRRPGAPRVILTAEQQLPWVGPDCGVIDVRVPPLRLRPADVKDYIDYFLAAVTAARPDGAELRLTPAARHHDVIMT